MTTDRPNTELAAVVDQALDMAEQQGVRAAAAFLTQYGADFGLICRVLQEPTRRRVRDAMQSLADGGVPAGVAARVLDEPERRRPIPSMPSLE